MAARRLIEASCEAKIGEEQGSQKLDKGTCSALAPATLRQSKHAGFELSNRAVATIRYVDLSRQILRLQVSRTVA